MNQPIEYVTWLAINTSMEKAGANPTRSRLYFYGINRYRDKLIVRSGTPDGTRFYVTVTMTAQRFGSVLLYIKSKTVSGVNRFHHYYFEVLGEQLLLGSVQ